jgi:hypothetical protein
MDRRLKPCNPHFFGCLLRLRQFNCIYAIKMRDLRIIKNIIYLRSLWGGGVEVDPKLFMIKMHCKKL